MLWSHWEYKSIWKIGLLQFHKCGETLNWVTLCKSFKLSLENSKITILRRERSYLSLPRRPLPRRDYLQCRCGRMNVGPTQYHWRMLGGCLTLRQVCMELGHPESLPAKITSKRPRNFTVWQKKQTKDTTQEEKKIYIYMYIHTHLFIYLFLGRGEGREKDRQRNINVWLCLVHPLLGTWPTTQACALTENWTSDPLVCGLALNPKSHTGQGEKFFLKCTFFICGFKDY